MRHERRPEPRRRDWTEHSAAGLGLRGPSILALSVWRRRGVLVLSALELAELPTGAGTGPQWHLSVSERRQRPSADTIRRVRRDFAMQRAEEDNHHPGIARHLWLPIEIRHRVDCECKTDEKVIVDPDGYTWTNPVDADRQSCRGCEFERLLGKRCPIHV
jgi:hypothetical protein